MGALGHETGDCEGVRTVAGSMGVGITPRLGDQSMLLLMIQKQTLGLTAPKSLTSESTEKASLFWLGSFNLGIGSWQF